jgi:ATP-dependent RNA helicase RhlE
MGLAPGLARSSTRQTLLCLGTPSLLHVLLILTLLRIDTTDAFPHQLSRVPRMPHVPHVPRVPAARSSLDDHDDAPPTDAPTDAPTNALPASFRDLGLSPEVLESVHAQADWGLPTPIQRLAIPQLLTQPTQPIEDNDDNQRSIQGEAETGAVWCEAPTGAGKTACYALPLLHNLLQKHKTPKHKTARGGIIQSLVLCPTRELATQIASVVTDFASHVPGKEWKILALYGGARRETQMQMLNECLLRQNKDVDVVVATPGRLVDLLTHYGYGRTASKTAGQGAGASDSALEQRSLVALPTANGDRDNMDDIDDKRHIPAPLRGLGCLVLDEADRLLGRGFASEMDAVLDILPAQVPTWLFSATFPKHMDLRVDSVLKRLTGGGLQDKAPVRISCTNSDRWDGDQVSSRLSKTLESNTIVRNRIDQVGPASTIDLRVIRLEKRDRTQALRFLLKDEPDWTQVLVFVATRYAAEHVSRKLRRAGIASAELHGKLDQDTRSSRLQDFKAGKIRVLLATDVASRGLDIVGLPAVINYDLPRSTADFVHRVGRTGRAGRQGMAITFCTPDSEAQYDLIEKRHLQQRLIRETLPGLEPDEAQWSVEANGARLNVPGTSPSDKGLAHDRMFGGVKGRRKSKKDKLREKAAVEAAKGMPVKDNDP